MNLSARWNRLSFLALTALAAGALAFGCTVTTGDIDDPDGGNGSNTNGKDSGGSTNDGSSTDTDSSTDQDSDTPNACPDNQQPEEFVIQSAACQACAEQKCCSQLVGCFNLDPGSSGDGDGGKNPTCAEYAEYYEGCIADCATDNPDGGDAYDTCVTDTCRIGNPAIADAWEAVRNCAVDSCAAECAGE